MIPVTAGIISGILKIIFKILTSIFKLLSFAIIYAIVGVVLYAIWGFNPFDGSLYAVLYLVGFGFSVLLSLLLAFRDKGGKAKKTETTWRWGKKVEADAPKIGFFESIKEKKRLKAERLKEEKEEQEKLAREEELLAQERRLEELRAERLREEIAREERLIEGYRQEAANQALQKYEEVVGAHPLPTERTSSYYDEVNYFSGDWGQSVGQNPSVKNAYQPPISPLRRDILPTPKHEDYNYFGALNNSYMDTKPNMERSLCERGCNRLTEEPKIYLSAIEPNTLIHEYSDRFEVYALDGGEKSLKNVVNKGE